MSVRLAPSLVACRSQVNAGWPFRDKTSDGWIGDAAHQQTGSDHNVGARDLVHALDVDEDVDGRNVEDGAELFPWLDSLRVARDPRIKYVLYEDRMFSSYPARGIPAWTWREYDGPNPHKGHGHISILSTVAAEQDTRTWFPQGLTEDDMPLTDAEMDKVATRAAEKVWAHMFPDKQPAWRWLERAIVEARRDPAMPTPEAIAAAVVRALPDGDVDGEVVEAAVRRVLDDARLVVADPATPG